MENKDLTEIREKLLEQKRHLLSRLEKIEVSKKRREPLSADSAEQSLELVNNEVVDALDQQERNHLLLIEKALGKIDSGSYGICTACGAKISGARLKALPFTPLCLSCAEET